MITATATLTGTITATAQIRSIQTGSCAPVTEQINGTTIGTVESGDTNNQLILSAGGIAVGTAANPSIVANSPLTINGSSIGSAEAEQTKNIVVNLDGSPSGSWDGDSWEVSSVLASLSIAASTSTPNFGDSITITATPTNITPTSYTFSITNGTQSRVFIQASAVLNWDVDMYGTVTVETSATSGAVATAIVASTTLTVSLNITKSLSQDGTNDYNVIAFDRTNDEAFSVTTWVKMLVTAQDCPFICMYSVDDTSNRPRLAVGYRQSTGNIECFAWNDFWNNTNNSAITADTDWHHLALTYDGSGDVNVYWDGAMIINVVSAINNQLDTLVHGWAQGWPSVGARFGNQRTTDTAVHSIELTSGQVATLAATLGASSGFEITRFPYITESAGQTIGVVTDIERGIRSNLVNFTAPYGIVTDAP